MTDPQQVAGHVVSLSTILALWGNLFTTAIGLLATIAALMWYSLCIYESNTMQGWLTKRRERRLAQRRQS